MNLSVEERLAALEAAVIELRQQQAAQEQPQPNWLTQITGSFKDDPVFDQILQYGQAFRRSDDPQEEHKTGQAQFDKFGKPS
jgi:hypothetical protein